jgi:hypothetical protein
VGEQPVEELELSAKVAGKKLVRGSLVTATTGEDRLLSYSLHFHNTDFTCALAPQIGAIRFRLKAGLAFLSHIPALTVSVTELDGEMRSGQTILKLASRAIKARLIKRNAAQARKLRIRAGKRLGNQAINACQRIQASVQGLP